MQPAAGTRRAFLISAGPFRRKPSRPEQRLLRGGMARGRSGGTNSPLGHNPPVARSCSERVGARLRLAIEAAKRRLVFVFGQLMVAPLQIRIAVH